MSLQTEIVLDPGRRLLLALVVVVVTQDLFSSELVGDGKMSLSSLDSSGISSSSDPELKS